ncbi:MAG: heparinase [Planctomycetota bacterium]|nr:MAG: heparinase [Planctomycetota bacterium]
MVDLTNLIQNVSSEHPRLLINKNDLSKINRNISNNKFYENLSAYVIEEARDYLALEPLTRIMEGRRLLAVSREYLKRIQFLGLAFLLTDDLSFAKKAQEEMLVAISFSDWNPSHMLDVAEMTVAMAIGYDWFYDVLDADSREKIKHGIKALGLDELSVDDVGWVRGKTNWNSVCHCGAVLGSLAVLEDYPELTKKLLERAIDCIPIAMEEYAPDGAYPEGPMYWGYGTSFCVLAIAGFESVFGTDFELSKMKGFVESATYYLETSGPSGYYFNYADCRKLVSSASVCFWFAKHLKNPSLIESQIPLIEEIMAKKGNFDNDLFRLLPMSLIWSDNLDELPNQVVLHHRYNGETPIGLHRQGWGKNDAFAGLKAGSPSGPHGHMDIGSFVYDVNGLRWAEDPGLEEYHPIEEQGLVLWDQSQEGDRWKIFKLNNFSHGTLTINDHLQNVAGRSEIINFSDNSDFAFTQIDMTEVYINDLKSAVRGMAMLKDGSLLVQDELQVGEKKAVVRWAMLTCAEVKIISSTRVALHQEGNVLYLDILNSPKASWELYDINPKNDWDTPIAGASMLGFKLLVEPNAKSKLCVWLHSNDLEVPCINDLQYWS